MVAGSVLKGFPKQWWPLATCSPKGRATPGESGGMVPRKNLQTKVLPKGNSDHFSTTNNTWISFSSLDFYIRTWWHSDVINFSENQVNKETKNLRVAAVQPKIVIILWGWAKESFIIMFNDWSCMSAEKIKMLQNLRVQWCSVPMHRNTVSLRFEEGVILLKSTQPKNSKIFKKMPARTPILFSKDQS